jgi:hypothetical protein
MKLRLLLFTGLYFLLQLSVHAQGPGYALDMTETVRYVSVPNQASLNPVSAITVEAWIYPTAWGVNFWTNSIVSKDDWSAGTRGFVLRCGANGTLSFNIGTAVGWREAVSPAGTMQLNRWQHVAGTFDGTAIKVYVDGVEQASLNFTGSINPSSLDMNIGQSAYHTVSSRPFTGWIDEVRMWEYALPAAELRQWMCRSLAPHHNYFPGLLGHWTFDEGQGQLAADRSFFQNNAALISDPYWKRSGAPLGDTSLVVNASPFQAELLLPNEDKISVGAFTSNPTHLHLYRVKNPLLPGVAPAQSVDSLDNKRQWGVFVVGADTATYTASLELTTTNGLHGCMSMLFWRPSAADSIWTNANQMLPAHIRQITFQRSGSYNFALGAAGFTTITTPDSLTFCATASATLNAAVSAGFGYQWLFNGTPIPGATQASYQANQAGIYQLEVITNAGCKDSSDIVTLAVLPAPNPLITQQNDTLLTGSFSSYQWLRNNNLIVGANQRHYRPPQSGDYRVLVSNTAGCRDTSETFPYFMTSVEATTNTTFHFWPNPARDWVYLDTETGYAVSLYDLQGRIICQSDGLVKALSVVDLPRGMYLLRVTLPQGVVVKKLLLE